MAMKWQVNILALVAAILGPVAVFSGWVDGGYSPDLNLIDSLDYSLPVIPSAGCWLFLIGVLICFLSPIGGILEIVGVGLFLNWYLPQLELINDDPMGSYLGVVSAIIALASMVKPFVLSRHADASAGIRKRLLVFGSVQE